MSAYASGTVVSVEKSRLEVERTIARYGCGQFVSGWDASGRGVIGFTAHGRQVRIALASPDPKAFRVSRGGRRRTDRQVQDAIEQETRRRWRSLLLVLKAKFEAVSSGISTFEDEFMAHIALPNGETVGQFMRPQIEAAYTSGTMPALLPMLAAGQP